MLKKTSITRLMALSQAPPTIAGGEPERAAEPASPAPIDVTAT